jgi:hypothetical protein
MEDLFAPHEPSSGGPVFERIEVRAELSGTPIDGVNGGEVDGTRSHQGEAVLFGTGHRPFVGQYSGISPERFEAKSTDHAGDPVPSAVTVGEVLTVDVQTSIRILFQNPRAQPAIEGLRNSSVAAISIFFR